MTKKITVIVCTRNRVMLLNNCLKSVLSQSLAPAAYDVLVVDNGSTDGTRQAVEALASDFTNIRYVYEPVLGLSKARNTGLAHTCTEFVAYIDDDAEAQPDWLMELISVFTNITPRPAVIAGEIDPWWGAPRPSWLTDQMLRMYSCALIWCEHPRFLEGDEWACEANIAFDVSALTKAGMFSEKLGRQGNLLLSGENFVNEIIKHNGGRIFYTPKARVRHFIPPERLTTRWLAHRYFWGGVTHSLVLRERERLFGEVQGWLDLELPINHSEWADLINHLPDDQLTLKLNKIFNLGYMLHHLGYVTT